MTTLLHVLHFGGTALDLEARDPGFETLWLQIIIFPNLGGASQGNRDVT